MPDNLKGFFENKDLVYVVDLMARRYNKSPYEVLFEMSLEEFNINSAVLLSALGTEKEQAEKIRPPDGKRPSWSSMGITHTVVKKKKD